SNVSYNVKKMVENGYLVQERSVHDRRSIHVRLTDKGRTLRDRLSGMHRRHIEMLGQTTITEADLQTVVTTLRRLERFWIRASARPPKPAVSPRRTASPITTFRSPARPYRAPMSRLLPQCCARRRSRSSRIAAAAPVRPCSGP